MAVNGSVSKCGHLTNIGFNVLEINVCNNSYEFREQGGGGYRFDLLVIDNILQKLDFIE